MPSSTPRVAGDAEILLGLLDVEPLERDLFRGLSPEGDEAQRVFGGQVVAQALMSAARTVEAEDHTPHSLHAYFLRGGDRRSPILYRVHRIRGGRSFTTRQVVAIQHGEAIFSLDASFQVVEDGFDHQLPVPWEGDADGPGDPDALPPMHWGSGIVDVRGDVERPDGRTMWFKAPPLGDASPLWHQCVLAYASDHGPTGAARAPMAGTFRRDQIMSASLDHAIWFHRRVRVDQWLRYDLDAVSAASATGLAWGAIHTAGGIRVATVAQEVLARPVG